jgi:hypothetical protein
MSSIYFILFCVPLTFVSGFIFGNGTRSACDAWGTGKWGNSSYANSVLAKGVIIAACLGVERTIEDSLGISDKETLSWVLIILVLLGSVAGFFIKFREWEQ